DGAGTRRRGMCVHPRDLAHPGESATGEALSPRPERRSLHHSPERSSALLAASAFPFLDVMWSMFFFFAWVMVVCLVGMLMVDNFRRTAHGGLAKAGWTVLLIFLPLLGALIYMIARPKDFDMYAEEALGGAPEEYAR